MRSRSALILVVIALVVAIGGWFAVQGPAAPTESDIATGTLMFPGLAPKLQQAARVEVVHQTQTLVIVLKDKVWGLQDRGGYPVQQDKLREVLTGLTELRQVEPRTSDPSEYARLGVEDATGPTAASNLLRVLDAQGKPLAELIIGHRRVRTQGNVPETIYVRRPGEAQAWLAEGRLPVDADPQLWIDRDIANIDHSQLASAAVTRGDEHLEFVRDGDKFTLKVPAEHPKLDDYKLDDVMRAFETLTLTDVKPAAQEPGTKVATSTFVTTDGMTIDVVIYRADKDVWAQFAAHGEGAAKDAADKLQARVGGWAYQLGSWKEAAFAPTLNDLKASEPPPAASANAAPPNAAGTTAPEPDVSAPAPNASAPAPDAAKPQ